MGLLWRLLPLLQHNIVSNGEKNQGFKYLLMTASHKFDCKDQIFCFSTYARWSSLTVWLALLIYVFICLKHRGFLVNLGNAFLYLASVLSCLAWHTHNWKVVAS